MSVIYVDISPFLVDYPIMVIEGSKTRIVAYSLIDSMGDCLTTLCYLHDIDTINIHGLSKEHCEPIVEEVHKLNQLQHNSQKEIKIEVI